ncbi:hypothetical protein MOSE0_H04500 [Monosporozyma servazzii]
MASYNYKTNSSSNGSIINKDEKCAFFTLPLDQIKLTSNPLDDYQRTLFSLVFADTNKKRGDFNNNILNVAISRVEYKSNLVDKLAELHTLIFSDSVKPRPSIRTSESTRDRYKNKVERKTKKKLKNPLYGLMYSFPDFNILSNSSVTPADKKNKSALKLSDSVQEKLSLNSTLYPQIFDINITTNESSKQHNNILIDNTLLNDGSEYSIVQNQIFKKENDLHFEHNQYHIFNRNNSVIWSPDKDFVFITGIWKLYQDAMYALSNIGRLNKQTDNTHQDICEIEFQTVLDDLFPNLPSRFSHNIKRRCSTAKDNSSKYAKFTDNTDNCNKLPSKYVEFHWDRIHHSIRKNFWNQYRDFLIHNKHIDPEILCDIEKLPFIQKVRGGYIHIQGTWLPIELARYLCITFAFPIRYLLVPLFGLEFPKQCEEWYANREQNMADLKATPLHLVYSKNDKRTGTGSSTSSYKIKPYSRSRIQFKKETAFSSKKKRLKDTATLPLEDYQRSFLDGQLPHCSVDSSTNPFPNINNFSNEANQNNEKNEYIVRKTSKFQEASYLNKEPAISFLLNPIQTQLHDNQHLNSINIAGTAINPSPHSPPLPSLNRDAGHLLVSNPYQSHISSKDIPICMPAIQTNPSYGVNMNVNRSNMMNSLPRMRPGPSLTPINPEMRPVLPLYRNSTMTNQHNDTIFPSTSMVHANNYKISQSYDGLYYASNTNFHLNSELQQHQQAFSAGGGGSWVPARSPYLPSQQFQRDIIHEDSTSYSQPDRMMIWKPSFFVHPSPSPNQIYQNVYPVFVDERNNIIQNNGLRPGTRPDK